MTPGCVKAAASVINMYDNTVVSKSNTNKIKSSNKLTFTLENFQPKIFLDDKIYIQLNSGGLFISNIMHIFINTTIYMICILSFLPDELLIE